MRLNRTLFYACITSLFLIALAPYSYGQTPATDPSPEQAPEPPQHQSLVKPLKVQRESTPYVPVTSRQRVRWFITNTIGPSHLAGGVITSAFGTALDRPKEYGPGWAGFGDRNGIRMTGVVTSNAMEASIGALWGEDPRYFRVPSRSFEERIKNVIKQAFVARQRDGSFAPAYARYAAITGSNFLSNSWREPSESNTQDALMRTGEGFAGHIAADAFEEFWPDAKRLILHRNR
jgi:hypothetical protein